MSITKADVRRAIQALGLEHRPVCLHASLRSFGWVEGGPPAIVEAFLEEGGTLLVPTFSSQAHAVAPPPDRRFVRNGWDDAASYNISLPTASRRVYTPESRELDKDVGALPAAVLARPDHVRGDHPLCSFSAVGPRARQLIEGQRPVRVYAPLEALAALGGFVVLAGVGLNRLTLLHLGEQQAGRTLFRRWAAGADGQPMTAEVGGCSEGFERLAPVLSALVQRARVGASYWRVFPASEVVDAVAKAIRAKPDITHCGDPGCERCRDAVAGGPLLG